MSKKQQSTVKQEVCLEYRIINTKNIPRHGLRIRRVSGGGYLSVNKGYSSYFWLLSG